jgi:thiamine-phosphate pyrophosphorylase
MIIPKLHYITTGNSAKEVLENIQKACTSGAELVQLRMVNTSEKKVLKVAKEAIKVTTHYQTRLIICSFYKIAKEIKADGVYLEKNDTSPTIVRKHLYTWQSIGGSANTLSDCEKRLDEGVDYICLGPLSGTSNNLGLNGITAITDVLIPPIPIIGFGGIRTEDVTDLLKINISGIAVSEAITQDFDSIKTFNQLLIASSTKEQRHTFK